ncbi:MAG: signal transduction histidine kinase [Flammeovirgaceae bacterium]|jgi:signal transduction histidine kinase
MIKRLLKVGFTSETSKAEKQHQFFLLSMALLMSAGIVLWSGVALAFGYGKLALVALIYPVFTVINITVLASTKKFQFVRFFQVLISLLLPFFMQWYLGGFSDSAMVMIWSVISLTGAMTYTNKKAFAWLVVYLILIVFSDFADDYFIQHEFSLSPLAIKVFFAFNIAILSIITFLLFFSTKLGLEIALKRENRQRKQLAESEEALQTANQSLMSSEEELRQNAEELISTNDNLSTLKIELEKTLSEEKESKAELQKIHTELKDAQVQLLQSEKMASIGQMTAGVAHEINNPINFIMGGTESLRGIIGDLLEYVELCEQLEVESESEMAEKIQAINKLKEELEIDELKEDIRGLLGDVLMGGNRAVEIVRGLKNFSRLDEGVYKLADIHEGLETTLIIIRNKLQNINLMKNYDESMPQIQCYPGELNQVFMNLLANAADAMNGQGTLTVTTKNLPHEVDISIKDTGSGMPQEVIDKIFEPFFTTKEEGKGTGLGLSISYGIIQKHKGELRVDSIEGKGTEFTIVLPKSELEDC